MTLVRYRKCKVPNTSTEVNNITEKNDKLMQTLQTHDVTEETLKKMNLLFSPFYETFINKIVKLMCLVTSMEDMMELYNLDKILKTNGNAYTENELTIDLKSCMDYITRKYVDPTFPIEPKDYKIYVNIFNILTTNSMRDCIKKYMTMWNSEPNRKHFIEIRYSPCVKISNEEYRYGLLKNAWSLNSKEESFIVWKNNPDNIKEYLDPTYDLEK
jgi:hypothetical protein